MIDRIWKLLLLFLIGSSPIFSTQVVAFDRTSDSLALVTFYNALDGPLWKNSWPLSQPIATWQGVTLNQQGEVVALRLAQNDLYASDVATDLPQFHLPALEELDLSNNNLNNTFPNWELPKLKKLNLEGCFLRALAGVGGSPQLTTLNVAKNILSFQDLFPLSDLNLLQFDYELQRYAPQIFFNIGGICGDVVSAKKEQAITAFLYLAEENELEGMRYQWTYGEQIKIDGPTLSLPTAEAGIYQCVLSHPKLPNLRIAARNKELRILDDFPYLDLSPQLLSSNTTEKCWEIRVQNFEQVISFQYGISWDPSILTFSELKGINLENFDGSYNLQQEQGQLFLAWLTLTKFDTGVSIADNEGLFTLCFDVKEGTSVSNHSLQLGGNSGILSEFYDLAGKCKAISIGLNTTEIEETNEGTEEEETTPPNSEIFEDYPWLANLIDTENCTQASVSVYDEGAYQYLLVTTAETEILYFQDGTLYCTNSTNFDCVAAYQLGALDQSTWSCKATEAPSTEPEMPTAETASIFDDYVWLKSIIDPDNCSGTVIRVYNNFIFIDTGEGGELYLKDGTYYCTSSPTYDCKSLYDLTTPDLVWSCDTDGNIQATSPLNSLKNPTPSSTFSVYPNPSKGLFYIKGSSPLLTDIAIYNTTGQLVKKLATKDLQSPLLLDVQALDSGVYYLHLQTSKELNVQKIVLSEGN